MLVLGSIVRQYAWWSVTIAAGEFPERGTIGSQTVCDYCFGTDEHHRSSSRKPEPPKKLDRRRQGKCQQHRKRQGDSTAEIQAALLFVTRTTVLS